MAMHSTRNTLPADARNQAVELLNRHLAAAIDLQAQLKQAHWNVRGPGFIATHELLDKLASSVGEYADVIAERAGGLGGVARGTVQTAAKDSFLIPYPLEIDSSEKHFFAVAGALAGFSQSARDAIARATAFGDPDTADLFTEISRGVDLHLWLVESHFTARN